MSTNGSGTIASMDLKALLRQAGKGEEAMTERKKTIELKIERTIPATLVELFDGGLDSKTPGTPLEHGRKAALESAGR
jgi:hypothetical protein